jgi:hypothetical protein
MSAVNSPTPRPFTIHVPDQTLAELKHKLQHATLPAPFQTEGRDYGTCVLRRRPAS